MLLVYTHKITPRLTYTMKQIFTRILGIEVSFTVTVEDFIKHKGPKITYTKQPLQNEFFVRGNDLLFEQGINDFTVTPGDWDGIPCFFGTGQRSNLPFDIFSASFYLISRYEEYLPHVKDDHGRFPPTESLAYQHGFLQLPVVDIWAHKMLAVLRERFPEIGKIDKNYRFISIIDVTTSHCFALRGVVRSTAGLLLDLVKLRLRRVFQRVQVWFDPKKDPYNNFEYLVDLHRKERVESFFFFQVATYSTYDKNVSPNSNRFKYLIKWIADYSTINLAASYSATEDFETLVREKKRLQEIIHRDVPGVRMRYNRIEIPHTYRDLVDSEFTEDYTMGYTHEIGFRAGTCTPFQFYDLNLEMQQPIKVHPFAVHDYAFVKQRDRKAVLDQIASLNRHVRSVDGQFITIFSNELLGRSHALEWKELYAAVITACHV